MSIPPNWALGHWPIAAMGPLGPWALASAFGAREDEKDEEDEEEEEEEEERREEKRERERGEDRSRKGGEFCLPRVWVCTFARCWFFAAGVFALSRNGFVWAPFVLKASLLYESPRRKPG